MSSLEAKIRIYNCDFRGGGIHVNVRKTHKEREERAWGNTEDLKVTATFRLPSLL